MSPLPGVDKGAWYTLDTRAEDRALLGSNKPNALSKRDSKTTVQITHPTHPLKGQVLTILPMVGGKLDANQALVALPNGEQRLIPAEWTDLVDHPRSLPGALFLFEHLVVLRQRLDYLLEKAVNQAILTISEPEPDRSGGSYVDQRSPDPVESDEFRTAGEDYCDSDRDVAAPVEPGNGGAA
jgi:hypothetical protein